VDILARLIGQQLSERWKQPVVVENQGGGINTIGMGTVKRCEPVGYTLRALGTSGAKRDPELPDVPPIRETVPGYVVTTWYSLVAPKGTPREIVDKLNREVNAILVKPDVAKQLHERGLETDTMTPDELGQHLRKEAATWAKVAREAKLKPE
jgi:tripartite-type tricarboxylate transporter receptor subunit TctC